MATGRTKADWADLRRAYLEGLQKAHGITLALRDRVWAATEAQQWIALPGATATIDPDHWWLGVMRDDFRQRQAAGAILLCASVDAPLLDFALPAELIEDIEPRLSVGNGGRQFNFNVFRRGSRFELALKGGNPLDITGRLGDVAGLLEARPRAVDGRSRSARGEIGPVAAEATEPYGAAEEPSGNRGEHRFFARYTSHGLEPLDPVDLQTGAVYLLQVRLATSAPRTQALRRILARGGPVDLPGDFAEQHDHYAHGSPRR